MLALSVGTVAEQAQSTERENRAAIFYGRASTRAPPGSQVRDYQRCVEEVSNWRG
jgi:hypothetical protein